MTKGDADAIDICTYDIAKCFDALWLEETINDLSDTGLNNDKLSLLYLENEHCKVAVKTPNGLTRRVNMDKIVMQGTVWGSLKCTAQQDKLGKNAYENKVPIYIYKNGVEIPPIGYVDDVLTMAKCGNSSVINNAIVNSFTESKKLKYGWGKCKQMHVGKPNNICPKLKVHEDPMKVSDRETYLGDVVTNTAKVRENILSRRDKGFGAVSDILSLISEVPLGQFKTKIALTLRQAMLINGMVYNSEAWSDVKESDVRLFEEVDEFLLRSIFKAHSKTPLEYLFLESGTVPIRFIISSRRLNYLHTILSKDPSELVYRVYQGQKESESEGDWISLVRKDCETFGMQFDESWIKSMSKNKFKRLVRKKMQLAALKYLNLKKVSHSKVKCITYEELSPQKYILSKDITDEQIQTLFALRSQMLRVKANFSTRYADKSCSLGCNSEETQEHQLSCKYLVEGLEDPSILAEIEYSDIFGSLQTQLVFIHAYCELLSIRDKLTAT